MDKLIKILIIALIFIGGIIISKYIKNKPKYVLEGKNYIHKDLKKVMNYFNDNYKNYQLCLVGEKETLKKDFQNVNNEIINIFEKNKKKWESNEKNENDSKKND